MLRVALIFLGLIFMAGANSMSTDDMEAMAREIVNQSDKIRREGITEHMPELFTGTDVVTATSKQPEDMFLFVSWSMGDLHLKAIVAGLRASDNVALVFRGIPEGMKMADAITRMARLAANGDGSVAVLLDPPRFSKYGVEVVPTLLLETEGRAIAEARGIASPEFLRQAVAEGKAGDLGVHGPVAEIIEPDLIDVMKEKVGALDFAAMKRGALNRFWGKQLFSELPNASKSRRFTVDPTVVSVSDMRDAQGKLIFPAGTSVNPLKMLPFTQRLVIFNPTRPAEASFAADQVKAFGRKQRVTLIATEFSRDDTATFMQDLVASVGANVFLLTPDVRSRFEIKSTPSVVTAQDDVFVIEEVALPTEGAGTP